MKKVGKVGKQWIVTRKEWFKANPSAYYDCYLRISAHCLKRMTKEQTTLDHVKGRGRHPELRNDLTNLKPCCAPCNALKGSRDIEDL